LYLALKFGREQSESIGHAIQRLPKFRNANECGQSPHTTNKKATASLW
jgi:hypothetical protein